MGQNDLIRFFQLKRDARLDLLYEYRSIVCGIYIYNKDSGFCGRDVIDVTSLVVGGHSSTESQLNIVVDEIENRIKMLTSFLDKHHTATGELLESTSKDEARCADVQTMVNVLIMHRQHMSSLVSLVRMMGRLRAEIECALRNFNEKLEMIRGKVQFKTAIPTEEIFVKKKKKQFVIYFIDLRFYSLTSKNSATTGIVCKGSCLS